MPSTTDIRPDELAKRWADLRQANPQLRNRDAAEQLGVSEAELVNCRTGQGTRRLKSDWRAIFADLPALGRVMALTRNEEAVHERRGAYNPASFQGHVGLVLGPDIDLRIFLDGWHFGFAVEEQGRKGLQKSLQFFDATGEAVHKIFAEDGTDAAAWEALVAAFAEDGPATPLAIVPKKEKAELGGPADREAFLADWAELKDTHDFFGLLRRHDLEPTTAFRLAEGRFTARLGTGATAEMLQQAAASGLPIMVFVGNPGMIQIHTGPVQRIERMGPWLNVLDPDFNLHLREDCFAETWLVRKPTVDGVVTSVEVFNETGGRIASYFGKRKPGEPELVDWRALAEGLAGRPSVAAGAA
jgi:putative hemin transport protein